MRKKIYEILNRIYGVLMAISFWGGFVPVIPFVIALLLGNKTGESITLFFAKQYYPWIITMGSIAIIIGLVAMYVGKLEGLSVKKINSNK